MTPPRPLAASVLKQKLGSWSAVVGEAVGTYHQRR